MGVPHVHLLKSYFKQLVEIGREDNPLAEGNKCLMQFRGCSFLSKLLVDLAVPSLGQSTLQNLAGEKIVFGRDQRPDLTRRRFGHIIAECREKSVPVRNLATCRSFRAGGNSGTKEEYGFLAG